MITKRESEIVSVSANFSDVLRDDEDVKSCQVFVYQHSTCLSEDFDIADASYVVIRIQVGSRTVREQSFPATDFGIARLCLLPPEPTVPISMLTSDSVDVRDNLNAAQQIRDKTVLVRIEGGTVGLSYKVVFTATTNFGNVYMLDEIILVIAD